MTDDPSLKSIHATIFVVGRARACASELISTTGVERARHSTRKAAAEISSGGKSGEGMGYDTGAFRDERQDSFAGENRKGRDIGYALATSSCEGANSMETCTVTAPDAITAFAVPNPSLSSQIKPVFSGLVVQRVAPLYRITQLTSDWQNFI